MWISLRAERLPHQNGGGNLPGPQLDQALLRAQQGLLLVLLLPLRLLPRRERALRS